MRIRVSAPASSANLGPGFDCLAAALGLRMTVDAVPAPRPNPPEASNTLTSLVLHAAAAVCGEDPRLQIALGNDIPPGKGLGSSGAAVAAGLVLGASLSGVALGPQELISAGLHLEGHADNLAASLLGGLVVVTPGDGRPSAVRLEPVDAIRPFALVADSALSTAEARRALPGDVPLAKAVANSSRSAALVAVLTGAAPVDSELLLECTRDEIHQQPRGALMPQTARLLGELRSAGVAAVVSGAGPSVLCLTIEGMRTALRDVLQRQPGWRVVDLGWERQGTVATIDHMESGE